MEDHISNKALRIHLIQQNIFPLLDLSDVKSCRLVCSNWNQIFEEYFVDLCCCCIRYTRVNAVPASGPVQISFPWLNRLSKRRHCPKFVSSVHTKLEQWNYAKTAFKKFLEDFTDASPCPFTRFRFEGALSAPQLKAVFQRCPRMEELTLYWVQFIGVTGLEVRANNLHVLGLHNNLTLKKVDIECVRMDLSVLPPSVEELNVNLDFAYKCFLRYSPLDTFPNLKSLSFGDYIKRESPLHQQCSNLRRLIIRHAYFNLSTVPASVKTIVISGNCEFEGETIGCLEKLVFSSLSLFNLRKHKFPERLRWKVALDLIQKLKPNVVVFSCFSSDFFVWCSWEISLLIQLLDLQTKVGFILVMRKIPHLCRMQERSTTSKDYEERIGGNVFLNHLLNAEGEYNLMHNDGIPKVIFQNEFEKWVNSY